MSEQNKFLNVTQAAELLGVKVGTIYTWVHQKKLRPRKHGSRVMFSREELIAWSDQTAIEPIGMLTCKRAFHKKK